MFTQSAPQLSAQLRQAGFSEQQVNALVGILGKCSAELRHRGPVTFEADDPASIDPNGDPYDRRRDPRLDDPFTNLVNEYITENYAINVAEHSTFNCQGDAYFNNWFGFGGDTFNYYNPVEITHYADTTTKYDGDAIFRHEGDVRYYYEGDVYWNDVIFDPTSTGATTIPFRNDHESETVPLRGIMRIVGVEEADGSQRLVCTQINNTTPEPRLYAPIMHAVNIGGTVAPDGTGVCVLAKDPSHWPLRIAYDPLSHPNDPEPGWLVGPGGTGTSAGSWKVTFGAPGFRVLGYDADENEEDEEHTPAPFVIVEPVEDIDFKLRGRYSHGGDTPAALPPFTQCAGGMSATGSSSFRGGEATFAAAVHGQTSGDPGGTGQLTVFNGPLEIPGIANPAFMPETAIAKPHLARLAMPSGSSGFGVGITGMICGPIPEGTKEYEQYDGSTRAPQLYLGLPGYRILSTFTKENDSDTFGLVWVIADNSPTWFIALEDIDIHKHGTFADLSNQAYTEIRCQPLQTSTHLQRGFSDAPHGTGYIPYDGSSILLPRIEVDVWFPVTNWMYPNVREGQLLPVMKCRYAINGSTLWLPADASYVDDPVGTIKIWNGAGKPVPAGWALCDGSNGTVDLRARFIVGHKSGDADHGTAWGTGGSKSHTHTAHGTTTVQSGSGAGVLADTNNHSSTDVLPPFMNVVFIQRVD